MEPTQDELFLFVPLEISGVDLGFTSWRDYSRGRRWVEKVMENTIAVK
jgi:hypothetical protein